MDHLPHIPLKYKKKKKKKNFFDYVFTTNNNVAVSTYNNGCSISFISVYKINAFLKALI